MLRFGPQVGDLSKTSAPLLRVDGRNQTNQRFSNSHMTSPKFKLRSFRFSSEFRLSWGILATKKLFRLERVLWFAKEGAPWRGIPAAGKSSKTQPIFWSILSSKHSLLLNKHYFNLYEFFKWWIHALVCRETQRQMFLLVFGRHISVPKRDTKMASPYKRFLSLGKTCPNTSHMKHRIDLIFGEAFEHIYLLLLPRF